MNRRPFLVVVSYLTIYVVWGSTYFFIRRSVSTIPAGWVLAIRFTIGGALLLGIAAARRGFARRPSLKEVAASVGLGILLLLVGNGLITLSEKDLDSYLAALLAASTPILVAVFDAVLLRKALTLGRVVGIVIGFSGVTILLYNGHSVLGSISPAVIVGFLGVAAWSLATSLGHRVPVHGDNTVNSGIQMLVVGLVSLVGCLIVGPSPAAMMTGMSGASLFGVLYLAIVGSLAFSAFTYLVATEPAERLVSYALVNPLIALLIGLGFGGESPTPYLAIGFPLILLGVAFMFYGERALGWLRSLAAKRE